MSNLFAGLHSAGAALAAFQRSMEVAQNNVSNASTPGFARQDPLLQALPFQLPDNLVGGVASGTPGDSRNQFAEQAVRNQVSASGLYSQLSTSLASLESVFDVTGKSGIPAALSGLFQAFSAWSTNPDSATARQGVLTAAQSLATTFQQTVHQVENVRAGVDRDLSSTVSQINTLAARIQRYNIARRENATPDAGLDASLNSDLEALSEFADITPLVQSDGTVTVLLGGQTPLVIGANRNEIQLSYGNPADAPNPNAAPAAHILNSDGLDITGQITEGKLGGLLQVRNGDIAALTGDAQQDGKLNLLAKQIADRVNQLLTGGQVTTNPPQSGVALFTYSGTSTNAAASLQLNSAITSAGLAAIDPGPPAVHNGIALALTQLGDGTTAANQVDGMSYLSFFSSMASQVGQRASDAKESATASTQLAAQAKSLRSELSGVSLDQEAIRLIELQRAYQAAARLVTIVNDLAETAVNLIR